MRCRRLLFARARVLALCVSCCSDRAIRRVCPAAVRINPRPALVRAKYWFRHWHGRRGNRPGHCPRLSALVETAIHCVGCVPCPAAIGSLRRKSLNRAARAALCWFVARHGMCKLVCCFGRCRYRNGHGDQNFLDGGSGAEAVGLGDVLRVTIGSGCSDRQPARRRLPIQAKCRLKPSEQTFSAWGLGYDNFCRAGRESVGLGDFRSIIWLIMSGVLGEVDDS